jgi:transposase-like protein
MLYIIPGIRSLIQYLKVLNHPLSDQRRPSCCPHCGKTGLWCHGYYLRKPDRESQSDESLNPILIQRYLCSSCGRTCSVLPECIPPRRWYMWAVHQAVLILSLVGKSMRAIAKETLPSRQTIRRWLARFKEAFNLHKDTLCNHLIELGRTSGFSEFWEGAFKQMPLSQAMYLCHASGVIVP